MLDELRMQANHLLKKSKNAQTKKKYTLIINILKNDKCFFEIPFETAYSLLKDLNIKEEEIMPVYQKLISYQEYDILY